AVIPYLFQIFHIVDTVFDHRRLLFLVSGFNPTAKKFSFSCDVKGNSDRFKTYYSVPCFRKSCHLLCVGMSLWPVGSASFHLFNSCSLSETDSWHSVNLLFP